MGGLKGFTKVNLWLDEYPQSLEGNGWYRSLGKASNMYLHAFLVGLHEETTTQVKG